MFNGRRFRNMMKKAKISCVFRGISIRRCNARDLHGGFSSEAVDLSSQVARTQGASPTTIESRQLSGRRSVGDASVQYPSSPPSVQMVIKDGRLIETVEGEMSVVAPDDPEVLELEPVTPVSNPSAPAQQK